MKQVVLLICICTMSLIISCGNDETQYGDVQININNTVGDQQVDLLSPIGSQNYPFVSINDQHYNLTLVKYIITEIRLHGTDGAYFLDPVVIDLEKVNGAYVVDETKPLSQTINLSNVPIGNYNRLSFTLGVEEDFVQQGATVMLDNMFWAWNAGYIAFKIEGQSPDSKGDDFGEGNPLGWSYHIGGWQTPNNNRTINIELVDFQVSSAEAKIGLRADVSVFINGEFPVDFSDINSVHDPGSGQKFANNLLHMFSLDNGE